MVLDPSEVSVCLQHPGFDVDLKVTVDTTTLYRVYLGRAELGGAIRAGQLTMSGPRTLGRGFGQWFTWSAFAPASRRARERRTAASRLAGPHRVRIAFAKAHRWYSLVKAGERIASLRSRRSVASLLKGRGA
jgi:hypothetical protein